MSFSRYWWILLFVCTSSTAQEIVSTFNLKLRTNTSGNIYDGLVITEASDGGVFIAGYFDYLNTVEAGQIIKLQLDGTPFPGFKKVFANGPITKIKELPSKKILILGGFSSINGVSTGNLVRLNSDGSLDPSFYSLFPRVFEFDVQSSGKIIATNFYELIRLNENGGQDYSFNAPPNYPYWIRVDNNDQIYTSSLAQNLLNSSITRFGKDGSVTEGNFSLDIPLSDWIYDMVPLSDGRLLICGQFSSVRGVPTQNIAILDHDSNVSTTFPMVPEFGTYVAGITVRPNGNILATGNLKNGQSYSGVEFNAAGIFQRGFFDYTPTHFATGVKSLSNGMFFVKGNFSMIGTETRWGIALFNSDNTLNQNFQPIIEQAYSGWQFPVPVQVDDQNRVIVVSTHLAPETTFGMYDHSQLVTKDILRVYSSGEYDPSYVGPNFGSNFYFNNSAIQSDGKLLLTGYTNGNQIVRLLNDGSIDNTFNHTLGVTSRDASSVVVDGNNIYLTGQFQSIDGLPTNSLAMINSQTNVVTTFSSLPTDTQTQKLFVQQDKKLLVSHSGTSLGEVKLTRLLPNGSVDPSFSTGTFMQPVRDVEADNSGAVYCAGNFESFNGITRTAIVKLTSTGELDNSFSIGTGFKSLDGIGNGLVSDISILPNGNILAAGSFSSYQNHPANGLVLLSPTGTFIPESKIATNLGTQIYRLTSANGFIYGIGKIIQDDFEKITGVVKIQIDAAVLPRPTLSASVSSDGTLNLNWTDESSNENGYYLEESLNDAEHFTGLAALSQNSTAYSKQLIQSGKYYYRINSFNSTNISDFSNVVNVTWDLVVAAPTNLSGVRTESNLTLHWDDNSDNEQGFKIDVSNDGINYFPGTTVGANVTEFTWSIQPLQHYYYRIIAYNGSVNSTKSNVFDLTWDGIPAPPVLATVALQNEPSLKIDWQDNSWDEQVFQIQRKKFDTGTYEIISEISANSTSYYDSNVEPDTKYIYRIAAKNIYGVSTFSNETAVTTRPIPPAPTILSGVLNNDIFTITWADNSTSETGYMVEVALDGVTFNAIATLAPNTLSFDYQLLAGSNYTFKVYAYNESYSSIPRFLGATFDGLPAAPSSLSATLQGKDVRLAWIDNSFNEIRFRIQRKISGGSFDVSFSVGPDVTTFTDTSTEVDKQYVYRVDAESPFGVTFSNEVPVNTPRGIIAPAIISATTQGNSVTVQWQDNSDNEDGFTIEKFDFGLQNFVTIATAVANTTSLFETVEPYKLNRYRVQAFNSISTSDYSNYVDVIFYPPLSPPTWNSLTFTGTSVKLSWADNSANEDSYLLKRNLNNAGAWETIATLPANTTEFEDTQIELDVYYVYRVAAAYPYDTAQSDTEIVTTYVKPVPPTLVGFSLSGSLQNGVDVGMLTATWTDNSNNEEYFELERSINDESHFESRVFAGNGTEAYDLIDPNINYYFRVKAVNRNLTSYSNVLPFSFDGRPGAPLNLTAASSTWPNVNLSWTRNSVFNTQTLIQRKKIGESNFATIFTVGYFSYSEYSDNNTVPSTTYVYRVISTNSHGTSAPSNEIQITTDPSPPFAPNITSAVFSINKVRLTWNDNASNEDSYMIRRSIDRTTWETIKTLPAGSTSFEDDQIQLEKLYYYVVAASNKTATTFSGEWNAFTYILNAPSNITTTIQSTANGLAGILKVKWQDNSDNEDGFFVALLEGDRYAFQTSLGPNVTETTFQVSHNTQYSLIAKAFRSNTPVGRVESSVASIEVLFDGRPIAPDDLAATKLPNGYRLNWTDKAFDEYGYVIERKETGQANFTELAKVFAPNMNTFMDAITIPKIYSYRVGVFNAVGVSYSNEVITVVVGLEDAQPDVLAYPNPTTGIITIDLENIRGAEIADSKGIYMKKYIQFNNANQIQLDVADLASGMYMLILKHDKGTVVKKFIKL